MADSLRDRMYSEGVQLLAESAPDPLFDAGTPQRAPAKVTALTEGMFTGFLKDAAETGRAAFARVGAL